MDKESYKRGFEDCVELCLYEIQKAENLEEARKRIREFLGLVKEDKLERLKERLWVIGQ